MSKGDLSRPYMTEIALGGGPEQHGEPEANTSPFFHPTVILARLSPSTESIRSRQ